MQTYTINSETNTITANSTVQQAPGLASAEHFVSESELTALIADWPTARLAEIWNNIPGVTRIGRFRDRKTAVARIWEALQRVDHDQAAHITTSADPDVTQEVAAEPNVAVFLTEAIPVSQAELWAEDARVASMAVAQALPEAPTQADVAPRNASTRDKPIRAKESRTRATGANGAGEVSKTSTVLALLKREGGTTLNEIMTATDWQAHSVRGFLSGTIGKKMGLKVESTKAANQERIYSIRPWTVDPE